MPPLNKCLLKFINAAATNRVNTVPSVGDQPLHVPDGADSHGHTLYPEFSTVVILEQVMHKQ